MTEPGSANLDAPPALVETGLRDLPREIQVTARDRQRAAPSASGTPAREARLQCGAFGS
ncbi:hypothetical protein [Desulfatiglans anilini]|uniref:hypothetical protein n=1 Tax=Desulfatiglans anilini TaxID=90728 RepID=UPI0012947BD6|nr:hypothetical protein [Desulfatiglans anilini]